MLKETIDSILYNYLKSVYKLQVQIFFLPVISSYSGCRCWISAFLRSEVLLCFWTPAAFSSFSPAPLPVALRLGAEELSGPHSDQSYPDSQGKIQQA